MKHSLIDMYTRTWELIQNLLAGRVAHSGRIIPHRTSSDCMAANSYDNRNPFQPGR